MQERNGILLVVVTMAIVILFAVATYDQPAQPQTDKPKAQAEEVAKPDLAPVNVTPAEPVPATDEPAPAPDPTPDTNEPEAPKTGQGVYQGRNGDNVVIQVTKQPMTFPISEELKADMDAHPEKYVEGEMVDFGFVENGPGSEHPVTITWMDKAPEQPAEPSEQPTK